MTPENEQLRFVAAALAMQALIPIMRASKDFIGPAGTAECAVAYADALLTQLEKPRPTI